MNETDAIYIDRIRRRAYQIYEETHCENAELNWAMAKMDIMREDYYRELGGCWHCGRGFER